MRTFHDRPSTATDGASDPDDRVSAVPRPRRLRQAVVIGTAGVLMALLAIGAGTDANQASPNTQSRAVAVTTPTSAGGSEPSLLTEEEQVYFASVATYLGAVADGATKLNQVMAGAEPGTSSLDNIRSAIEIVRAYEAERFAQDYSSVAVPAGLANIDQKVRRCKRIYDLAFAELAAAVDDEDGGHIRRGGDLYKRGAAAAAEAVNAANAAMTKLAEQRRKDVRVHAIANSPSPGKSKRLAGRANTSPQKSAAPAAPPTPSDSRTPTHDEGKEPAAAESRSPLAPGDCSTAIERPLDKVCTAQFCRGHTNEPRCMLE